MMKNNVTRFLTSKKIKFTVHQLEKEKHGAATTAKILGVSEEKVFKSIVIQRMKRGKFILVLVNGNSEVDLKKVAKAINEKKVILPSQNDAEKITGLQSGGISPLALINKGFQFLLDESCKSFKTINISGGERGLNIEINPDDLTSLLSCIVGDYSKYKG